MERFIRWNHDEDVWKERCKYDDPEESDENTYFEELEAIIQSGYSPFVKLRNGKLPLHYAAKYGNYKILKFLLRKYQERTERRKTELSSDFKVDIFQVNKLLKNKENKNETQTFNAAGGSLTNYESSTDDQGKTALHYAAKKYCNKTDSKKYVECIKLLMPVMKINLPDKDGYTAVTYTVMNRHKDRLQAMLSYQGGKTINFRITPADGGETAFFGIVNFYPEMRQGIPDYPELPENDDISIQLLLSLREERLENFQELYTTSEDPNPYYDEPYHASLIEIACSMLRKEKFVELLLTRVDPNTVDNKITGKPLLHTSVEKGKLEIFKLILKHKNTDINKTDRYGRNALHHAARQRLMGPAPLALLQNCIHLLLHHNMADFETTTDATEPENNTVSQHSSNIHDNGDTSKFNNFGEFATNALEKVFSIPRPHVKPRDDVVTPLNNNINEFSHPDSEENEIGVDVNLQDNKGDTALHLASRFGHEETVLTLLKNDANLLLLNEKEDCPLTSIDVDTLKAFLDGRVESSNNSPEDADFFIEFHYEFLQRSNQADHQHDSEESGMDALLLIAKRGHMRELLKHPVLSSFLLLRWQNVRMFFYLNILFCVSFVGLLSTYILMVDYDDNDSTTIRRQKLDSNRNSRMSSQQMKEVSDVIWYILTVLLAILVLREIIQLVLKPKSYLSGAANYLECALFVCTGIVMYVNGVSPDVKRHLSPIIILMSWGELIMVTGRLPILSSQLEMLKKVMLTFLKYMPWYFLVVIAFSLSFYALFREIEEAEEENMYLHPLTGVFKTVLMMTGEYDMSGSMFDMIPITSHLVFLLFIFLVAIVILNLLSGLAVGDTNMIREKADILSLVYRVKLVVFIQDSLKFFSDRMGNLSKFPDQMRVFPNHNKRLNIIRIDSNSDIIRNAMDIVAEKKKSFKNRTNWNKLGPGNLRAMVNKNAKPDESSVQIMQRLDNLETILNNIQAKLCGSDAGSSRSEARSSRRSDLVM